MSTKELKSEARQKLPLNIHLAVAVYAIEFFLLVSAIAIVVMSFVTFATAAQAADIAAAYPTTTITATTGEGDTAAPDGTVSTSASEDEKKDDKQNETETDKQDKTETEKKPKVGVGSRVASVLMIIYGVLLFLVLMVIFGMVNFSLIDYYLATYRCKPYGVRGLGETLARGGIGRVLVLNVLRTLFGFLLLLCLIVPGVIFLMRTSMANHLLIANPKLSAKAALRASNKVMTGKTGGYFTLCASFIGWYLLCIVTFGLGFIFVLPYANLTKTVYYKRVLQGDKAGYISAENPVVQQSYSRPAAVVAEQVDAPVIEQEQQEPVAAQEYVEPPVSPIDTLDADGIRDINDAMADVNGKTPPPVVQAAPKQEQAVVDIQEQPVTLEDIPEIPIYPINSSSHSVSTEKKDDEMHKIDGFDIFESVRDLSQTEMEASDSYDKKFKNLFEGGQPQRATPARNYFGTQVGQRPDDFVTSEVSALDEETGDPPLDDEGFAEFLRTFDKETQVERSRPVPPRPQPTPVPEKPEFGATLTTRNRATESESRADRARREREERMRNINRK